jgi:hypothetical protein
MKVMKIKKLLFAVISCIWMNCTPAMAQTPRDSAAERSRTQKKSSPADDQNSPGSGSAGRVMLQDTGGKSGTQGIGRKDGQKNGAQSKNDLLNDYKKRNKGIMWGVGILVILVLLALIGRYKLKNKRA